MSSEANSKALSGMALCLKMQKGLPMPGYVFLSM